MHPTPSVLQSENKALIRRWFEEVWNRGRSDLIDQFRAHDAASSGLGEGGSVTRGEEPFRTFHSNLLETFPDLRIRIEDILAEGDKVAVRFTAEGTHQGNTLGPEPTGRKVTFGGIIIVRIANGKIVESWNSLDQLAILKQTGILPANTVRENFLTTRV